MAAINSTAGAQSSVTARDPFVVLRPGKVTAQAADAYRSMNARGAGAYNVLLICVIVGLHVGIYDHLGWAVAVTASDDHYVVDRRRIELLEQGVPAMPIHHPGKGLSLDEIEALVARVRASAERATAASLDALSTSLAGPVTSMHLRALPADFPTEIAVQLRAPYEARADAVMYREVLADAARTRGWVVEFYDAKTAEADATTILADRANDVLRGPRDRLGPPWTKDHRAALAATVLTTP